MKHHDHDYEPFMALICFLMMCLLFAQCEQAHALEEQATALREISIRLIDL